MVSQIVPSEFVFHILYKMKGFAEQRMSYSAQDLSTLLKMLNRTEGISVSSTEKLVIHQVLPDNTVMEVLDHDIKNDSSKIGTNVIPFRKSESKDVAIMEEVHRCLVKAREGAKPEKKLVPLRNKVVVGYGIFAHEARSGDEYE